MELITKVIRKFRVCKNVCMYNLFPVTPIQEMLNPKRKLTDKELYDFSIVLEPRLQSSSSSSSLKSQK